jgi:demethylmenaquinone methyltransferase/2-methoxy-6-polyprenyl-1,4-benzoquinol methylase
VKASPPEKHDPRLMRNMFGVVAPRYDFITRAFSYGMDRGWKRQAVERATFPPAPVILDLACGTGDFARLVAGRLPRARVVASDLTLGMLLRARETGIRRVACADAMRLPFRDAAFDAVFVGYGLRNFPRLQEAVSEIRRVLRPGGMLVSLDFFLPRNPLLRRLYLAYLVFQGFFWGFLLHGRPRVYTYIPASLRDFVSADEFCALLRKTGYREVAVRQFIFGGIALHWAARDR